MTEREHANIGYKGGFFISDTDSHSGKWRLIVPIETTIFNTLTSDITGDTITGESFPANHELRGNFTVIKLTSGACMAYE